MSPKRRAAPVRRQRGALLAPGRGARIVLVTVPSEAAGRRIARALVKERLAACGNLLPIAASVYQWKGKIVEESEYILLLKTRSARLPALARRVLALHPYELPEILVLPVERGLAGYLAWVGAGASG